MGEKITRRSFIKTGAGTGLGAAVAGRAASAGPIMVTPGSVKPVVVASANGNKHKNGGPHTAVEEAFGRGDMANVGTDPVLDNKPDGPFDCANL